LHNLRPRVGSGGYCGRFTVEVPREEARSARADEHPPGNGAVPSAAALAEVAEKLSKLREHLDQVVATLNAVADERTRERGEGAVGGRFRRSRDAARSLRCHECGRIGLKDDKGWTLRLCRDDELHAFCSDCDRHPINGA
jgi:hypothetical protein